MTPCTGPLASCVCPRSVLGTSCSAGAAGTRRRRWLRSLTTPPCAARSVPQKSSSASAAVDRYAVSFGVTHCWICCAHSAWHHNVDVHRTCALCCKVFLVHAAVAGPMALVLSFSLGQRARVYGSTGHASLARLRQDEDSHRLLDWQPPDRCVCSPTNGYPPAALPPWPLHSRPLNTTACFTGPALLPYSLPPAPLPAIIPASSLPNRSYGSLTLSPPPIPDPIRIPTSTPIPNPQRPWPLGAATRCGSAPCAPLPAVWPPAGATCWLPPPSAAGRTTPRSAGASRRCVQGFAGHY